MSATVTERLAHRIGRDGPIAYSEFVDAALYGPDGFFTSGGGPGRADGDFLTSPETGSLFGALVAGALTDWWREMGSPDPFFVVEVGAGDGRLAREVLRAEPACAPALRYVLVERSEDARAAQAELLTLEPSGDLSGALVADTWDDTAHPVPGQGPILTSLADLPAGPLRGVVFANELLDNLPFDVVARTETGWDEVRVGVNAAGELVEVLVRADSALGEAADHLVAETIPPVGAVLPVPRAAGAWLATVAELLESGVVAIVDYAASVSELVERGASGEREWIRTFRAHERVGDPLTDPGTADITIDLPLEYLRSAAHAAGLGVAYDVTQAQWLSDRGIEHLVAEGEQVWAERAHLGDLEALAGRSRANEALVLTADPGLGAHRVLVLHKGMPKDLNDEDRPPPG